MDIISNIFQINDGSLFSTPARGGVIWYPLILVIAALVITLLVFLYGKLFFRNDYNKNSNQVKPFNSGNTNEINYNVPAQNLYWGFRKTLDFYYKRVNALHTGDLTDYIKWMVICIAIFLLLVNGGLL